MEISIHDVVAVYRDDRSLTKTNITNLAIVTADGNICTISLFHDTAMPPISQVGDAGRESRHKAVAVAVDVKGE
ncbi:MAG: hypothetical protein U9Q07_02330 [Planctomycetota bacterium]|nr:hypothetical protein [Planctomycetota bacterium]